MEIICHHSPSSDNPWALNEKQIPSKFQLGIRVKTPKPHACLIPAVLPSTDHTELPNPKSSGLGPGSGTRIRRECKLEENANLTPPRRKYKKWRRRVAGTSLLHYLGQSLQFEKHRRAALVKFGMHLPSSSLKWKFNLLLGPFKS